MRRILVLALVIASLTMAISVIGKVAGQTNLFQEFFQKEKESKKLLLPDMMATKPKELFIRVGASGKSLRFSTTFYNKGIGPLELIGHNDAATKKTYASQYIYEDGGSGIFKEMGEFIFHPTHSHWHLSEYVFYELWSIKDGHEDKLLLTTDKMSFCIWDQNAYDLSLPEAAKTRFYTHTCYRNTQGMSVGWSDTYSASTEGQEINLKDVPDGTYIFRTIINPDRKIEEMDYDNNKVDIFIVIKGNSVTRKETL